MKIIIALIALTLSSNAFSQDASELDRCSQTLARTEGSLTHLDQNQVHELLSSVNRACLASVEFSEWANELIYATVTETPAYFISSFASQPAEIQANILKELESPVNDGIDIKKAYAAINSTPDGREKSELLAAIKVAADKIGLTL